MEKIKKIMIHSLDNKNINKLNNYLANINDKNKTELTFDDGLYSQYKYFNYLKDVNLKKIYFISTGIIRPLLNIPNNKILSSEICHSNAFANDFNDFMNYDEIFNLNNPYLNSFIGLHGHYHILFLGKTKSGKRTKYKVSIFNKIKELSYLEFFQLYRDDVIQMKNSYINKKIQIRHFCYPYNIEIPLYRDLIYKYLDTDKKFIFYGNEREDLEHL